MSRLLRVDLRLASAVALFGAISAISTLARAQAAQPDDSADEDQGDDEDEDEAPAPQPDDSKPVEAKASVGAEAKADATDASSATTTTEAPAATSSGGDDDLPLTLRSGGWSASLYGFAELDVIGDSTRSFPEGTTNATLARPNTVPGDNPRVQLSARNSRFGFKIAAPAWGSVRVSTVLEVDFFGTQGPTTTETEFYTAGPMRMRHFYGKLESPVVDLLAGQYHDLFGWGGSGFYPNTVAYLPVVGEVYHRNPQVRFSKTLAGKAADFEVAVAAVRPVQRDSGLPDGEAGMRLALNGWKGANVPGAAQPGVAPLEIGVSGVIRRLAVNDFSVTPGNPKTAKATGLAVNVFLPVIPAHSDGDLSNAFSITGEFTTGSGISDLYSGLTGGIGYPQLPNPNNNLAVPTYVPNLDAGVATFDAAGDLHTVDWRGVMVNAHYHLPIADGKRVWISGTFATAKSDNALEITPIQGRPFVWDKGTYFDGNLWWSVTPSAQLGLSFQHTEQTFGDGVVAKNNRGQGAFYFFF